MRKALLIAAALAALSALPVVATADGICVCGMKRPLRVEGGHVMHRPLRADGLHHLKKPL